EGAGEDLEAPEVEAERERLPAGQRVGVDGGGEVERVAGRLGAVEGERGPGGAGAEPHRLREVKDDRLVVLVLRREQERAGVEVVESDHGRGGFGLSIRPGGGRWWRSGRPP